MGVSEIVNVVFNFIWILFVDLGYIYFVCFYFCELWVILIGFCVFNIYFNNWIVENGVDIIVLIGNLNYVVFCDYFVRMDMGVVKLWV